MRPPPWLMPSAGRYVDLARCRFVLLFDRTSNSTPPSVKSSHLVIGHAIFPNYL